MKEFNKTNNHEIITRICDAEQEDPYSDDAVCVNYEWLYTQIEELCVPKSKLEELIKCVNTSISENLHCWSSLGKQSVIDDLQKLIDDAKNG